MSIKNYFYYDLETNGLDYYTTGIMQLSLLDINGNAILNQYVYPYDDRIDCTQIHGIDEKKLIDNNAIPTVNLCMLLKNIFRELCGREDVHLIAYNNFGYDQIILENNFKLSGIKMPNNWFFVDLYPIIKELYPTMKPNHKLSTVFQNICGEDESLNFHCALGDSIAMHRICETNKECIALFPKYTRGSMQSYEINNSPITSLNGYHKSLNFEGRNINTIGDIYDIFKKCNMDKDEFESYLRNMLGLYSNFLIGNIIKQITVINRIQL